MNERVYINGIPLSDFGVVLGKDSYKSLLQWSPLKAVKTNDWAEYDYIELDLDNPTLDKRTVTLNFHAQGVEGYETFMEYLQNHSYNSFSFPELGITLNLRVDGNTLQTVNRKWQSFNIAFIDDLPYSPNTEVTDCSYYGGSGYVVDSTKLSTYGVYILKDTLKSIRAVGKVKQRLLINENSQNGAVYDYTGQVNTASSDFQVKCLIRALNAKTCVRNYYALLRFLTKRGLRKITVQSTLEVLGCYYKSATCENVHLQLASGAAGIAFTITFTLTDKGVLRVLSDDDSRVILSGDGNNYLILR